MDISALEAFLAINEKQSFSEAAASLFITQPAISKRIHNLEQTLNCQLFDRIGRNIFLTEAGKTLLPNAQTILQQIHEAKRQVKNLQNSVAGELKIASSHHIGLHYLPPILKQLGAQFPDINTNIQFLNSETAINAIVKQDIEMAFITLPETLDVRLSKACLWHDPLQFVIAKDHPLAQKKHPLLNELAYFPAILPEKYTTTFQIVQQVFTQHHLPLKSSMSVNYLETIKALVSSGLGWSVLPTSMIDQHLWALPLNIDIARQLGWIRHKHRSLTNAAQALLTLAQ